MNYANDGQASHTRSGTKASSWECLSAIVNSLPDFALAAAFLITWVRPDTFGEQAVKWLVLVMLMEFLAVHSGFMMSGYAFTQKGRARRSAIVIGLGAFYALFAGGIALASQSWRPLIFICVLVMNRLIGVLFAPVPDAAQKAFVIGNWAFACAMFVVGCTATAALRIPPFGVTPAVVAAQRFEFTGLYADKPETALAFGFIYFFLVALFELIIPFLVRRLHTS